MEVQLAQIERHDPTVNAICTRAPEEQALAMADAADRAFAESGPV